MSFLPIAVFLTSVTGGLRALQQEKAKLAFTFPGVKGEKEDVRLKKEKGGVNTHEEVICHLLRNRISEVSVLHLMPKIL